jgi:N-carbamoyl-D-amino-acid hydrolase
MKRPMMVAAAQLGPIGRREPRSSVVGRLLKLMEDGAAMGCQLLVFPEMALTTFFPRWKIDDEEELSACFEHQMPGPDTQRLFDASRRLGVGFYLGYCEQTASGARYNTSILVENGEIRGKYRKVHVPGNPVYDPALKLQHLERWYFQDGDLGFRAFEAFGSRVGMLICNDRRWPESWRVLGLQGAELVCLGYNSPAQLPDMPEQNALRVFHHLVPMQAAAYQNGTWIVAAAKAGREEGCDMMGSSCVIAPSGEVVAISYTVGDELVPCRIDLEMTVAYKKFFDFDLYRRPECYTLIVERKGIGDPV